MAGDSTERLAYSGNAVHHGRGLPLTDNLVGLRQEGNTTLYDEVYADSRFSLRGVALGTGGVDPSTNAVPTYSQSPSSLVIDVLNSDSSPTSSSSSSSSSSSLPTSVVGAAWGRGVCEWIRACDREEYTGAPDKQPANCGRWRAEGLCDSVHDSVISYMQRECAHTCSGWSGPGGELPGSPCSAALNGAASVSGWCFEAAGGSLQCGRMTALFGREEHSDASPRAILPSSVGPDAVFRCPRGAPVTSFGRHLIARPLVAGCAISTDLEYDLQAEIHVPDACHVVADYPDPARIGCMVPSAFDFNPSAVQPAPCAFGVVGCLSPTALNYNPQATIAPSSSEDACVEPVYGCTVDAASYAGVDRDTPGYRSGYVGTPRNGIIPYPEYQAVLNFDPAANAMLPAADGGAASDSCVVAVEGCRDSHAVNYDAAANVDSLGWCVLQRPSPDEVAYHGASRCMMPADYPSLLGRNHSRQKLAGVSHNPNATFHRLEDCVIELHGCMSPTALNFDPHATVARPEWCWEPREGCLNPGAVNFNCTTNSSAAAVASAIDTAALNGETWGGCGERVTIHNETLCRFYLPPPPPPPPPPFAPMHSGAGLLYTLTLRMTVAEDCETFGDVNTTSFNGTVQTNFTNAAGENVSRSEHVVTVIEVDRKQLHSDRVADATGQLVVRPWYCDFRCGPDPEQRVHTTAACGSTVLTSVVWGLNATELAIAHEGWAKATRSLAAASAWFGLDVLSVEPANETYTVLPAPPGPPGPDHTLAIAVGVLGGLVAIGMAVCAALLAMRRRRRLEELRIAAEEEAERNKEYMTPRSSARARFGTSPAPAWLRKGSASGGHTARVHPPDGDGDGDGAGDGGYEGGVTPGMAAHMTRMALEASAASAERESPEFSLCVVTPLGGAAAAAAAAAAAPDSDGSSVRVSPSVSPPVDMSPEAVASRRARLGKAAGVFVSAGGGLGDGPGPAGASGGGVAFSIGDGGDDDCNDGDEAAAAAVADGEAMARAAVAAAAAPQQSAEQAAAEVRRWLAMGQPPMPSLAPTEVRAPARRLSEKVVLGDAKAVDAFIREGAAAAASGGGVEGTGGNVAVGGVAGSDCVDDGGAAAAGSGGASAVVVCGASGGGAVAAARGGAGAANDADEAAARQHATTAWLQKLGLPQYAPSFARESMEPNLIASVLREDGKQAAHELLQALGVGFLGHRLRMISALAKVDVVEV